MIEAAALPSEAIVKNADQQLEALLAQKQDAEQRLEALIHEQVQLHQERASLVERRAQLEKDTALQARTLEQAEMDAKLAASSPIASPSATAKLKEARQSAKTANATRQNELARIEDRQKAIAQRLETIQTPITDEQGQLGELARQIELTRESRNRASIALGQEVYAAHIASLDQAKAHLDDLAAQLMNAQITLAQAKDVALTALWHWPDLREQAIRSHDLLSDETTRILDAYVAFCDVLASEGPKLVYRIGQQNITRDLEITARDVEMLVNNATEGRRILAAKQSNAVQIKHTYLDRVH